MHAEVELEGVYTVVLSVVVPVVVAVVAEEGRRGCDQMQI